MSQTPQVDSSSQPSQIDSRPVDSGQTDSSADCSEKRQVLDQRVSEFVESTEQSANSSGEEISPLAARANLLTEHRRAEANVESVVDTSRGYVQSVYLYNGTPGSPEPAAAATTGVDVDLGSRSATATADLPAGHSVAVQPDRSGIDFSMSHLADSREISSGLYVMKDWAGAQVSRRQRHADGRADKAHAGLIYVPGGAGIMGGGALRDVTGKTLSLRGFAGGDGSRKLLDLGDYQGLHPDMQGKRRVCLQRELGGFTGAYPGVVLASGLGIGGRLSVYKNCAVQYTTHVDRPHARQLLFEEGNVVSKGIRNRARALGIKDEPLPPPDLSKPEQLKVGDSLTLTTEGTVSGGLVLGAGVGAFIGAQGAMVGEFQMTVEKPGDDIVQVTVLPTKVRTLQISGRALVLDATASRDKARAMSQSFCFDMSKPEAVEAYQALLQGELPGGEPSKAVAKKLNEGPPVVTVPMPDGVERSPVEHLVGMTHRSHVDLGFMKALFGQTNTRGTFDRTVEHRGARLSEHIKTRERQRTIPLSGDETRGVSASLMRISDFQDPQSPKSTFLGLKLLAFHTDTKARGFEVNSDIQDFNRAFGTEIGEFQEKSLKKVRSIQLQLTLGEEELEALAQVSNQQAREACQLSGTKGSALLTLKQKLAHTEDPEKRAMAVQDYVGRRGFSGMGALVRLLGADYAQLTTTVGAIDSFLGQASTLLLQYEEPISPDASNDALVKRFKSVHKLQKQLKSLTKLLIDDPMLQEAQRQEALQRVKQAQQQLPKITDVEHLSVDQRHRLIQQLEKGWTTTWEQRVVYHLSQIGEG